MNIDLKLTLILQNVIHVMLQEAIGYPVPLAVAENFNVQINQSNQNGLFVVKLKIFLEKLN